MTGMAAFALFFAVVTDKGWTAHVEDVAPSVRASSENRRGLAPVSGIRGAHARLQNPAREADLEDNAFEAGDELDNLQPFEPSDDRPVWQEGLFSEDDGSLPPRGHAKDWLQREQGAVGNELRDRLHRNRVSDRDDPPPVFPTSASDRRAHRSSREIDTKDPRFEPARSEMDEPRNRLSQSNGGRNRYPDYELEDENFISGFNDRPEPNRRESDSRDLDPIRSARSNGHLVSTGTDSTRDQTRRGLIDILGLQSGAPEQESASSSVDRQPLFGPSGNPSWPFLLSLFALFASLGFNLYLGWIAWDIHARYQDVVADLNELEGRDNEVVPRRGHSVRHHERESDRLAAHA